MRCVFDPTKDKVNRAKHGVSLALAEVLFAGRVCLWRMTVFLTTTRFARWLSASSITGFLCAFTPTGTERRVISLRKANRREVKRYGENLE